MANRNHLAPTYEELNTTPTEIKWNLHTLKQEDVECNDEKTPCNYHMYTSDPLDLSENVNYYDSKDYMLKQVKKEFSEDEFPESDCRINKKGSLDNNELLKGIKKEEVKHEMTGEGLLLNIKEEDDDVKYQFTLKTEWLEKYELLKTSTDYELRINPQEQDTGLLHKLDKSSKRVTRNSFKCKYCNENFKHKYRLTEHMKLCHSGKVIEEIVYKCDSCLLVYKSKQALALHVKRIHHHYGKMFRCWCGKEFRSPLHLGMHRRIQHDLKIINKKTVYKCKQCEAVYKFSHSLTRHVKTIHCINSVEKFQCDSCKKYFTAKQSLLTHIKRFHYDYGKVFECWCGIQYRSPIQLDIHKKRKHIYVHEGFKFIFS